MTSFLNKDIDITNKSQEEIQESLLTQKQFNPKSENESQINFAAQEIADDNQNKIYVLIVKANDKEYKILVSFSGRENTFKELTQYKYEKIKKINNLILITYLPHTKLKTRKDQN